MQPQRETTTDSLASIMQVLQLGYRSGTLTVERTVGEKVEEGLVVFTNGQIVSAQASRYTGVSAFNYLRSWGSCRFSFLEGVTSGSPLPEPPASSLHMRDSGSLTPSFRHIPGNSGSLENGATDNRGRFERTPGPKRSAAGEAALYNPDAMQISRLQRRLLLLINGQRGLDELARLMARTAGEIHTLLDELEQAGFILQ